MNPVVRQKLQALRETGFTPVTREQIKAKREEMNLSLDSLAHLAGVTPGTVSSIHAGRPVSAEMLAYLMHVMTTCIWNETRQAWGNMVTKEDGTRVPVFMKPRIRLPSGGWGKNKQYARPAA